MNINLKEYINSTKKFEKVWESPCKNHRILYFQIDKEDTGIDAHFHPNGEDSALVLQGELNYDINFEEQMVVKENNLVFGWTNIVHGYHNVNENPLHVLVFATPEHNPSEYRKELLPTQHLENIRHIEVLKMTSVESHRMLFSAVPPMIATNCLYIDLKKKWLEVFDSMSLLTEGKGFGLYVTFK